MFMKMEPKDNKKRDGRHCDLCGCSFPAVRCDKCNSQIFCLSCDDMYHRHPKRRFHLRKAVDPSPTPLARPVLPMKVSNLSIAPGDPSKMPLPPPRKKKSNKSIFNTFRKGSPASDTSPTLPQKEYSWCNRFGSIKKFMSQRPLPPVPDNGMENITVDVTTVPSKSDFSFTYSKGEEKPPALPQRNQTKLPENFSFPKHTNDNEQSITQAQENGFTHGDSLKDTSSESGNQWSNGIHQNETNQGFQQSLPTSENVQGFGTMRRQTHPLNSTLSSYSAKENFQNGMHSSSSATDLHALSTMVPNPGMPAYPQYPFNPHMAPQYQGPFPMYPQYPVYPQYFGNSWANLSNPMQTTDGDFSDQSENSPLHFSHMRNATYKDKKGKRSHSLVDRVPYQGQFYPYGPFSSGGYPPPPWISDHHVMGAPPSPSTSLRSLNRLSLSQRRKKVTDEEDYNDDFSSSPLSRPKSSSSEVSKLPRQVRKPSCLSSSSDEETEKNKRRSKASPAIERRQLKQEILKRRASSPRQSSASRESPLARRYSAENKSSRVHVHKGECKEISVNSACEPFKAKLKSKDENEFVPSTEKYESDYKKQDHSWIPLEKWHCKHCTFLNEPGEKICRVCCKTVLKSDDLPKEELQSGVRNDSNSVDLYNKNDVKEAALTSEKHDIALLNSALDEAEKEITRSIDELLKIKEESSGEQDESQQMDKFDRSDLNIKNNPQSEEALNTSISQEHAYIKEAGILANISELSNNTSTSRQSHIENNERLQINHKVASITMPEIAQQKEVSKSSPAGSHSTKTETETSVPIHTMITEPQTRKDSFCQTYQDVVLPEFSPEKNSADSNVLSKNYIHPLDKVPSAQPPLSFDTYNPDRGMNGIFGLHRAHSRASLFGGRLSDASPAPEYGGIGLIPSSMYRSLSRSSLLGDAEGWTTDYHSRHKPDFYLSMEELVERRRQESMRAQGLELVRMIREAEQQGFTADDIQVALNNCGKQNPVNWLQENWKTMIHTVLTLATNYGRDKKENDVGGISQNEARYALRLHKGNIWAAVTECVEGRQRKVLELSARGNFSFREIIDALTLSEGNVEMAYSELTKTSLKPFLMRVWGSGEGAQNLDAAGSESFAYDERAQGYLDKRKHSETVVSDKSMSGEDIWDDEDYDYEEWEDDGEGQFKQSDKESRIEEDAVEESSTLIASHNLKFNEPEELEKSSTFASLLTPESDKSEYCDAIGSTWSERYLSSTSIDEIYLLGIDEDEIFEKDSTTLFESKSKGTGFLKKLANLKKVELATLNDVNASKNKNDISFNDHNDSELDLVENSEDVKNVETVVKNIKPHDISKQSSPSLIDTVTSSTCNKKLNSSLSERRTIVVYNKIEKDSDKSISLDSLEKLSFSTSCEPPFCDENQNSMSYGNIIDNSNNSESNFEGNVKSLKVTKINDNHNSDFYNPVCSANGNILSSDAKNANEITDKGNSTRKKVMDETNDYCIATEKTIPLEDGSKIADCRNEAASPKASASPDLCIVNNKKIKKSNKDKVLKLVEKSKVPKNELNALNNDKISSINIQDIKDMDNNLEIKSSAIDLATTKNKKNSPNFPPEKTTDVHVLLSKNNNEFIGEKYQQIDMDNNLSKPILPCEVLVENRAGSEKSKENSSLLLTTESTLATSNRTVTDNSEITIEMKKSKDEKFFSCRNYSDMVPTAEDNKAERLDINDKHQLYGETHEKVLSLTNEALVAIQEDSMNNHTANKLKNRTSVQNLPQVDDQIILEATKSSLTAKPIKTMTEATHGEQESVSIFVTDSNITYEPGDNNTSLVKVIAESGDQIPTSCIHNVNIDVNNSISRNQDNEYVLSEECLKPAATINTYKEFIEVSSPKNDIQCIEHDQVLQGVDSIHMKTLDDKIMYKMYIKETDTNKPSQENGFKNSTTIEETISERIEESILEEIEETISERIEESILEEIEETILEEMDENSHVINLDSHNSVFINSKAQTMSNLPTYNSKETSNLQIKPLDTLNSINSINEVSELIPMEINEKNAFEILKGGEEKNSHVLKEREENISEVLKIKNASEILKMEENSILEVGSVKKENVAEVSKIKEEFASGISELKEKHNLEALKMNATYTSEIPKVIEKNTKEVSKINEENALEISKIKGTDHVSNTSIDKNIPKLSSESQLENSKNNVNKLTESFPTVAFKSTETNGFSKNNLVDIFPDHTNNVISEKCELQTAMNNISIGAENFNLLPVNPLRNDIPEDSDANLITAKTTVSKTASKLYTLKSSSTEESDTDLMKNEDSPYSTDDSSKTEIVSEDISTDGSFMSQPMSPIRPIGPLRRMSFNTRKEAIIQERSKDLTLLKIGDSKPWFLQKKVETFKPASPKRSIKQQLEFERRVRKLVTDRKCRTYRKAEVIVQLLDMNFDEYESIEAAHECSTLEQAISFLQQECQLCAGSYPIRDIISMVHCSHKACRECIKAYFTIQIRDRTIMELLCPFCNEPDITDEDVAQDYFNHLDMMLKKLVEEDIHELFQRKLRDRVLMKDPNFMWCTQCSSGFIADPYLKRLICPDCKAIMCASCRRLWEKSHERISCEAFAAYKDSMDPQTTVLAKLLIENGIDCPNCHFKYALAKGGCMHFKCIQCQHDFCSGCSRPFKMGQKCGISEFCAKLGLHAHHPRNCLFYLRDKEPEDLEKLLDMNDIKYDKDHPDKVSTKKICQVMEQKETAHGMIDDICGKEIHEGYAGLCRLHYVEYLGQLVNKHKIDPIQIFDNDDLELVLKRASIRMPPRKYREAPDEYRNKLLQVIEERLPLAEVEGS